MNMRTHTCDTQQEAADLWNTRAFTNHPDRSESGSDRAEMPAIEV